MANRHPNDSLTSSSDFRTISTSDSPFMSSSSLTGGSLSKSSVLQPLMQAMKNAQKLNQIFQQYTSADIAAQCQAVFYRDGVLGLQIQNQAYAARIRFLQKSLMKQLQKAPLFKELQTIKLLSKTEHQEIISAQDTKKHQKSTERSTMPDYFQSLKSK